MRLRDFHPNVRQRIYLAFFSSFLFNLVIPYMTIYFARELGAWIAGLALTVSVVLSLDAGFWSGYVSDRIGRKKLMVGAELLFLAAYAALALTTSPAVDAPWIALAASIARLEARMGADEAKNRKAPIPTGSSESAPL